MKVLVACEESQTVTIAFRNKGHEAYSCDIQECSGGRPEWHLHGNVLYFLNAGWDLMIAHPPCTYLANAGLHYLKTKPERKEQLKNAFEFVLTLWSAPISKIAIENPVGWLSTNWKRPTQIIQPYYFGDNELKTTCLWLKHLPKLQGKIEVAADISKYKPKPIHTITRKTGEHAGKPYNYYWRQGKSAKERSKTFLGIAQAMAEQWG